MAAWAVPQAAEAEDTPELAALALALALDTQEASLASQDRAFQDRACWGRARPAEVLQELLGIAFQGTAAPAVALQAFQDRAERVTALQAYQGKACCRGTALLAEALQELLGTAWEWVYASAIVVNRRRTRASARPD